MLNSLKMFGFGLVLVAGSAAAAGHGADPHAPAATLAGILADMNHYPSDADRRELDAIAASDAVDDDLRAIARAIAGIEHTPSAEAEARLNGILASEAATEAEKILAGAVLRFEHKASVEDQSALERLAGQ